jgi:hypothetical protein
MAVRPWLLPLLSTAAGVVLFAAAASCGGGSTASESGGSGASGASSERREYLCNGEPRRFDVVVQDDPGQAAWVLGNLEPALRYLVGPGDTLTVVTASGRVLLPATRILSGDPASDCPPPPFEEQSCRKLGGGRACAATAAAVAKRARTAIAAATAIRPAFDEVWRRVREAAGVASAPPWSPEQGCGGVSGWPRDALQQFIDARVPGEGDWVILLHACQTGDPDEQPEQPRLNARSLDGAVVVIVGLTSGVEPAKAWFDGTGYRSIFVLGPAEITQVATAVVRALAPGTQSNPER